MSLSVIPRNSRGVVAVLGPTNTGKTHLAIERMLGHKSGLIGLPLRLLAREIYNKIADRIGEDQVSLITGEERIDPPHSRYQVCTVEAMPESTDAEFVAIDEVQLCTNLERGHVFTNRVMNLRGKHETMLLGASTIEATLRQLMPGLHVISRPRMSLLTYAGSKKITRLPARSALVAFSAGEVYAIAELIRRQRGGAAVVMGSLSPRTRNAQVALYQSGDVDFLVATDAIGMGLNLDVHHVAFAQENKFDGYQKRRLTAAEMGQIAGRAGRHTNDGTFGVTGNVNPFEDELIEALETHQFPADKVLMWRNSDLDFSSVQGLIDSLDVNSDSPILSKSPGAVDVRALDLIAKDSEIRLQCSGSDQERNVRLLWEICRIPDFRKISPGAHVEILSRVFMDIAQTGAINTEWFAYQTGQTERFEGEIDALSNRLAHVRTWTYLANRENWLENQDYWREKTRDIEHKLSDALHEALTKRFIDRRTSLLMKRLRENAMLEAEISEAGEVVVEGHHVGKLHGFRFTADTSAEGPDAKAAKAAAMKALAKEIDRRAAKLSACPNSDIILSDDGHLRWLGQPVAKIVASENGVLKPDLILLADEQLTGDPLEKVKKRLDRWLANHVENMLRPLVELSRDETISGTARGLAFQLVENLGHIDRRNVASDVKSLDQDARATLRRHGVRFGAFHIFLPLLLKPAPTQLICILWAIQNSRMDAAGLTEIPGISATGRTSVEVDPAYDRDIYPLCGFRIMGKKAVRIDILERLADLIRPAISWKEGVEGEKPDGAFSNGRFYVTPAMLSILGATHEDMEQVLKNLGYKSHKHLERELFPEKYEADAAAGKPEVTDETVVGEQSAVKEAQNKTEPEPGADKEAASEPEEEKTVLLWQRHFKSNRPAGNQNRGKGQFKNKKGGKKPAKSVKNFNKNKQPSKQPERALDPDSPFAKLAQLKETMKGS